MKKLFLILFIVPLFVKGQDASIHFDIKNSTVKNISISFENNYTEPKELYSESYFDTPIIPMAEGKTDWIYQLSQPVALKVYYETDDTLKQFEYYLFLYPGDDLRFQADENNLPASIKITGKGSENNQPMIQSLHDSFLQTLYVTFKKDSLPNRVFDAIKEKNVQNLNVLEDYIAKYHPSKEFIRNETIYTQYFPLIQYMYFKGSRIFYIHQVFMRNEEKWQVIEDSLVNATPISNNNDALNVSDYAYFLSDFLLRTKEKLWRHPELEQQYYENDVEKKLLEDDPENLLREKIIEKNFTGITAEFLYAEIFKTSINQKEDNLPEIFERFKQKYSNSGYIPYIEPAITKIEEKRERKLTDEMILITNTDSLRTFDDILKLVKNKTVLLDMWGTWCGPCRAELSQHSDSIKQHFIGKRLDYLYIANYDLTKEAKWKELIPYYNLTGTNILANKNLTNDIMKKVGRNAYPTYVIIKKDGTFELSEADYPMNQEILFKQLDRALNEN